MAIPNEELNQFKPGESGNPSGKPKGTRNRSTIVREILALNAKFPAGVFEKLQEQYPELKREMTIEQMMTIVQADKAIRKQDTAAYEKILDSAYGKAKQEIDQTNTGDVTIKIIRE